MVAKTNASNLHYSITLAIKQKQHKHPLIRKWINNWLFNQWWYTRQPFKKKGREFPGSPAVGTQRFHCQGPRFQSLVRKLLCGAAKNKIKRMVGLYILKRKVKTDQLESFMWIMYNIIPLTLLCFKGCIQIHIYWICHLCGRPIQHLGFIILLS